MARATVNGLGQGLDGDKTTTGAICNTSMPNSTQDGRGVLRLGDVTTECPKCGKVGIIIETSPAIHWNGKPTALDGARIQCDCPAGSNRLIAPARNGEKRTGARPPRSTHRPAGRRRPVCGACGDSRACRYRRRGRGRR